MDMSIIPPNPVVAQRMGDGIRFDGIHLSQFVNLIIGSTGGDFVGGALSFPSTNNERLYFENIVMAADNVIHLSTNAGAGSFNHTRWVGCDFNIATVGAAFGIGIDGGFNGFDACIFLPGSQVSTLTSSALSWWSNVGVPSTQDSGLSGGSTNILRNPAGGVTHLHARRSGVGVAPRELHSIDFGATAGLAGGFPVMLTITNSGVAVFNVRDLTDGAVVNGNFRLSIPGGAFGAGAILVVPINTTWVMHFHWNGVDLNWWETGTRRQIL